MLKIVSSVLIFLTAYSSCTPDEPKKWALVISTTHTWTFYAGEACMCHAYQIVKKHGIPEERIVSMLTDDVAYNKRNPTPGIIINRPNGPDVYHGVHKDYSGEEVTPENFLKVLSGDEKGLKLKGLNGKVIKSGPNDHIFVYYIGHGGQGVFYFNGSILHASTLHSTIMKMHEEKKYGKMVFYVEACESGSMFEKKLMPKDINVFVVTAANPHEPSYACFFDKLRQAYLSGVYSNSWLEDSDKEDLNTETLQRQYVIVRNETNTSHVMEYGDMKMGGLHVGEFQGSESNKNIHLHEPVVTGKVDVVPFDNIPLATLHHKVEAAKTVEEREMYLLEIQLIVKFREAVAKLINQIATISVGQDVFKTKTIMTLRRDLTRHTCYVPAVDTLHQMCPGLLKDGFALRQLYILVNLCEEPIPIRRIKTAIETATRGSNICTQN